MWSTIAYTIAWSLYQSLVFFALVYLMWAFVFKSKLITIKPSQQFSLLVTLLIIGSGHFLYLLVTGLLQNNNGPKEVLNVPLLQNNYVNGAIVVGYFLLAARNSCSILKRKWKDNGKLVLYSVDRDFKNYLDLFCQHVHMKVPAIYCSTKTIVPYTTGLLKKIIVLPMAMVNNYSVSEFEAIILHELAHIKRNDHFWNLLMQFCTVINSINPFAQLLIKQAVHERELACDDWVLQQEMSPKTYAETLFKIAAVQHSATNTQLALAVPQNELLFRIKRLFDASTSTPVIIKWKYLPLLMLGLFINYLPRYTTIKKLNGTSAMNTATKENWLQEIQIPVPVAIKAVSTNNENCVIQEKPIALAEIVVTELSAPTNEELELSIMATPTITRVSHTNNAPPLIKSVVNSNYTKVNDAVLKINDSIALFNINISNESVTKVTNEQLSQILAMISENNSSENLALNSKEVPLKVFQNGIENFYYGNASVDFQLEYNADKNNWVIIFTIKSGDANLAVRTVDVALTKRLQTIDF